MDDVMIAVIAYFSIGRKFPYIDLLSEWNLLLPVIQEFIIPEFS